jgi:hypothetical protein
MKDHRLFDNKHPAYSYLWAVANKRNKFAHCVRDLISPGKEEDPVNFWLEALFDPNRDPFLRFHKIILHGLKSNKISMARAAEVFEVDTMTMRDISLAQDFYSDETEATH